MFRTCVRVVCSYCLHRSYALRLVADAAHGIAAPTTITCPNPTSHLGNYHITLSSHVAQKRTIVYALSLADRAIVTGRIVQALIVFLEAATPQKVVDLARVATTGGGRALTRTGAVRLLRHRIYERHTGYVVRTWRTYSSRGSGLFNMSTHLR